MIAVVFADDATLEERDAVRRWCQSRDEIPQNMPTIDGIVWIDIEGRIRRRDRSLEQHEDARVIGHLEMTE